MDKRYKRKYHFEWISTDHKPKNIKKNLESANRLEGKRDIKKELDDLEEPDLSELRWQIENDLATKCYEAETEAEKKGLEYKCTCIDVHNLTKEEVLEWHGLKWSKK